MSGNLISGIISLKFFNFGEFPEGINFQILSPGTFFKTTQFSSFFVNSMNGIEKSLSVTLVLNPLLFYLCSALFVMVIDTSTLSKA